MTRYGPWTKIQKHREDLGLRRNELAEMAGIARSYMTMLENGDRWPTLAVTIKLAHALGVSTAAITRRKEPSKCSSQAS